MPISQVKISKGTQKISLTTRLANDEVGLISTTIPISLPASIVDQLHVFDIERSVATLRDTTSLSARELADGARLFLSLLGLNSQFIPPTEMGEFSPTEKDERRSRLTMTVEQRAKIVAEFRQINDWSESAANAVLDIVVSGLERNFRTSLANLFVRNRLLEIEDDESGTAVGDARFEDVMAALDQIASTYTSFLRNGDVTSVVSQLITLSTNRLVRTIMNIQNIMADSDAPSVTVSLGAVARHLTSHVNRGWLEEVKLDKVGIVRRLDFVDDKRKQYGSIGMKQIAGYLLYLMQIWHNGSLYPEDAKDIYEKARQDLFSPFSSILGESLSLDFLAIRKFFRNNKREHTVMEALFMDIFMRQIFSNALTRNFGSYVSQVTSLLTQRQTGTDDLTRASLDKHLKALSLIRETFIDTFAYLRSLLSDSDILYLDVTPAVRMTLLEVLDKFISSWQTFYTSADEVRFTRTLAHLVSVAPLRTLTRAVTPSELMKEIGYAYNDADISYDGPRWINNEYTGDRRLHVRSGHVFSRSGDDLTVISKAPVENIRPLMSRFSVELRPFFFIKASFRESMLNFPAMSRKVSGLPYSVLKEMGLSNFLISRAAELQIFHTKYDFAKYLQLPTDLAESYCAARGGVFSEPWVFFKDLTAFVLLGEGFDYFEVGPDDSVDKNIWPFVSPYPFYSVWEDKEYIVDFASSEHIENQIEIPGVSNRTPVVVPEKPLSTESEVAGFGIKEAAANINANDAELRANSDTVTASAIASSSENQSVEP